MYVVVLKVIIIIIIIYVKVLVLDLWSFILIVVVGHDTNYFYHSFCLIYSHKTEPTDEASVTIPQENQLPIARIKACVCITLQQIIERLMREDCTGCHVNHPSQRRHSCIYEAETYFYQTNFQKISRELYKPTLLHTISHFLGGHGQYPNLHKIWGAVECYAHELLTEPYICAYLENYRQSHISDKDSSTILETLVLKKEENLLWEATEAVGLPSPTIVEQ